MSFMEGFANAVSDNIEDKRKRRRDQEDDIFSTNYKLYLSRQEDRRKQSENENKLYGKAQFYANRYGLGEDGAKVFFQYFNGGGEEKELAEMMKNGTISFGEAAQPKAPMSTGQEMKNSGLDMETVDVNEDSYVPKLETGRSALAVNNMDPQQAKMTASQEKVVKKIADATGDDETKVRETIFGQSKQDLSSMLKWQFKPNNNQELEWIKTLPTDEDKLKVEQAKMYAMGDSKKGDQIGAILNSLSKDQNQIDADGWMIYEDPDTKEMINSRGKVIDGVFYKKVGDKYEEKGTPSNVLNGMMVAIDDKLDPKVRKEIFTAVQPFQEQKTATLGIVRASQEAAQIVDQNPAALTATARAISSIQGLSNELDAVDSAIKQFSSNPDMPKEEVDRVSNSLITRLKSVTEKADTSTLTEGQKRLLRLQMDLVYSQLKAYGETGRGISNFDIKQQMFLIFDERPERFRKHLQSNVKSQVENLEANRRSLMQTYGDVILQSRTQGYMNDSAQQQVIRLSGSKPEIVQFMDESNAVNTSSYTPEEIQQTQPENAGGPVQVKSKEEYDNLQPGQEYIDPNGVKRRKQ